MKYISILGSTGSIGTQTLEVIYDNQDKITVLGLTTNENIDKLEKQIDIFNPKVVAVMNKDKALMLKKRIGNKVEVLAGLEGVTTVASLNDIDIVLTAVPGMIGLIPTLEAIDNGIDVALANKETLVSGGNLVMEKAKEKNIKILPVDSEHSAIFQCLMGNSYKDINKVILTASGGPFRGYSKLMLEKVTLEQALKHPNWSMGKKVTIDSATLMNKGLEVIEAKWLFDLNPNDIEVVVHPQSIIHSLVEFKDHSTLAQLGYPDMKVPIQLAIFYPNRINNKIRSLNLSEINTLTFEEPNTEAFLCLEFAFEALRIGGSMPTVLNAANEIAVEKFLRKEIGFLQIPKIIEQVMSKHDVINSLDLNKLLDIDCWSRKLAKEIN